MKKQSFVEKVLSFLKGGEEAKISRFSTKLEKYYTKQISIREDEIESLRDKIIDAKESLTETILNINPEAVATTEGAESYCKTYTQALNSKLDVVEQYEEQIKNKEEEINRIKKLKSLVFED